ncbi:hypothetical protein BKA62DRAFT_488811 [Auriculariales sp. MPI-PUGE-AT-0066]|nr:hypothetical protein BKA62DRAFT_488811 [Auriculariales sp. MPI-PUGE-AT-0066]
MSSSGRRRVSIGTSGVPEHPPSKSQQALKDDRWYTPSTLHLSGHSASFSSATATSRHRLDTMHRSNIRLHSRESNHALPPTLMQAPIHSLPPELLLPILTLATDPPLPLLDPTFDSRHYPPQLLLQLYTSTQRARLTVALVCKKCAYLVLPKIYAYTWLHRRSQARALARTLQYRPERAAWIRRVDVDTTLGGARVEGMQANGLDLCAIVDAVVSATQVVSSSIPGHEYRPGGIQTLVERRGTYLNVGDPRAALGSLLTRLAVSCVHTLRQVHITAYPEQAAHLVDYGSESAGMRPDRGLAVCAWLSQIGPLAAARGLRELEIDLGLLSVEPLSPFDCVSGDSDPAGYVEQYIAYALSIPAPPFPTFDRLETLGLDLPADSVARDVAFALLTRCSMPAVDTLRLHGVPQQPSQPMLDFLHIQGSGVHNLELGPAIPRSGIFQAYLRSGEGADVRDENAPNLSTVLPALKLVIIGAGCTHSLPHPWFNAGHPSVQIVAFRDLEAKVRAQHSGTVLDQLRPLFPSSGINAWPALKEIRTLTYGDATMRKLPQTDPEARIVQLFWKRLLAQAVKDDIRVTDVWGREVCAPVGEVDRGWNIPLATMPGKSPTRSSFDVW